MQKAFLGLYQRALAAFQALQKAVPPASSQMLTLAQSQILLLQANIQALQGSK